MFTRAALRSRVLDSILLEMPYWQAQQGGIDNGNRQLRTCWRSSAAGAPRPCSGKRNQLSYRSTSSIGATLFRGRRASIDDLLKQADLAMYRSKAVGRNALRFFDPAMELSMLERAALETDLREAIQSRQLLLHYQAQVDDSGRLTGAEALVRWRHPLRGLVAPAEFIPLAEETGLILPLGQWVLQTACRQLVAWAAQPAMRHLSVAVNVSVRQFSQEDFVEQVLEVLDSTGADLRRLKLELTESLLVANVGDVIAKMSLLKAHGVGFSLDDFAPAIRRWLT